MIFTFFIKFYENITKNGVGCGVKCDYNKFIKEQINFNPYYFT